MGQQDAYQAQWNLKPKIEALRSEATAARGELAKTIGQRRSDVGVARDQAAREQYAAEQAAKSADIQIRREDGLAAQARKEAADAEAAAAKEDQQGDHAGAAESREIAIGRQTEVVEHEARSRQATLDAAKLRDDVAGHARRVTEFEVERQDVTLQARAAEAELDKIEQRADLLQQARTQYTAESLGTADASAPTGADLVARADAIAIDRSLVRTLMPEFPDATPGYDNPPPPLPDGAEGSPGTSSGNDTDLLDPSDQDGDGRSDSLNDTDLLDPNDQDGDGMSDSFNDTDLMDPNDVMAGESGDISGSEASNDLGADADLLDPSNEGAAALEDPGLGGTTEWGDDELASDSGLAAEFGALELTDSMSSAAGFDDPYASSSDFTSDAGYSSDADDTVASSGFDDWGDGTA